MHQVTSQPAEGGDPHLLPPAGVPEIRFRAPGGQVFVIHAELGIGIGAFLLIAVHAVATALRLQDGWWWQDDFNILGLAAERPLGLGLLLRDYNGHLQPATWLMAWLVSHLSPYAWWTAAAVQAGLVVATDVAFYLLLRRLFGVRPAILIPLAAFCASAVTLTSTLWWAAALQWLPVSLSLALALLFHVNYLDGGRRRNAVGAVAVIFGGLFCFEKALTILPVLTLFSLFYLSRGRWWRRPFEVLRQAPRYWAIQIALAVGWLVLYRARTSAMSSPSTSIGDTLDLGRQMMFYTVIPGVLGGPIKWFWYGANSIITWPTPPPTVRYLAWAVAAVVLIGSLARRRGAWRAWAILGIYASMTIILVAHARGGLFGPTIGRDLRYSTDLALLTPLCAALAWLPLRLHSISAAPQPREDAVRMGPRLRRQMLLAGALLVVLVTVGGLVSGARYMKIWTNNPSESYVDNLRDGLARATSVTLFDQGVPAHIMIPEFGEGAQLSRLTRALNPRPHFVTWAPELNVVDEQGRIHPAKVEGIGSYLYQPVCGRQKVTVPLTGSVLNWVWKAQITYSSTQATTAEVSMDGRSTPVSLLPGQHDLFVAVMGGGTLVTLSGLEPGARICVTSAVVGNPVPR